MLPGVYKIECWGASGGYANNTQRNLNHNGGKGGYASGIFNFSSRTTLFARIGGKGLSNMYSSTFIKGGYNGGGTGGCGKFKVNAGSGGGATDLRFQGDDLKHRIIIAGGGGGASITNGFNNAGGHGGHGGGEIGGNSAGKDSQADGYTVRGANQTTPGWSNPPFYPDIIFNGSYGIGGPGTPNTLYESSSGGGGGGLFGGGGGAATGGSGGSGYVTPLATSIVLIPGYLSMPNPNGGDDESGHQGNGNIRITRIRYYKNINVEITCLVNYQLYQLIALEIFVSL